jgi:hypothetical protein
LKNLPTALTNGRKGIERLKKIVTASPESHQCVHKILGRELRSNLPARFSFYPVTLYIFWFISDTLQCHWITNIMQQHSTGMSWWDAGALFVLVIDGDGIHLRSFL